MSGALAVAASHSLVGPADAAALRALLGDRVRLDEPMSRHTTLKIGGPADAWAAPASQDELVALVCVCAARGLPITAVGGGSNLLVKDGGVRGVVLSSRNLRGLVRETDAAVRVEAGLSTGKLLAQATAWQLGGLEFLGGVPGSVGGGLVMNAGTTLGEFTNVTTDVWSVRLGDGAVVHRDHEACGFAYRSSALPPGEVVASARLVLRPRPRAEIEADVRDLRDRRAAREPHKVHNAGSVFKNPPGDFAGRLIEAAGLKGTTRGGAECSPVHANWFVSHGAATAADMFELIALARREVHRRFGVELQLEWKVIGDDA